ncbi:MAG: hypothetical protein O2913_14000 [Chloroflexi bacterium]|nr:hypothetical protein [Chloroflexota bacterium]
MPELTPEDLYQLKKMQMDTEKKALELQKSQQDLNRFVLDLEHKHGLLAAGRNLDINAVSIKETVSASSHNGNGKGQTKEFLSSNVE